MKETNVSTNDWTGFFVGALVGAAVGAGVALLVAPRTGKEARNWLAQRTREIKDRATSAFQEAKETVRQETKVAAGQAAKEMANVHDLIR